jgi:hypothetical protein
MANERPKCFTPMIAQHYATLTPEEKLEFDRKFREALDKIRSDRKLNNSSNDDDLKA